MAIKAVIWDVGGVIIKEDVELVRDMLAKKFGFESSKFKEYAKKTLPESFKGKLHYLDFFRGFIQENNIKATPADMAKAWEEAREKASSWIEANKDLLVNLSEKYVMVSLTNSTKLNDSVKIREEVYELFKINIVSCEVEMRKPEKEIYELVLSKLAELKIKPSEAVFLDNKEENLVPAKELGIQTIFVKEETDIESELAKLGVKI